MKKLVYISCLILSGFTVFSQRAEDLYDHLSYQEAIEKYEGILEKKPQDGDALFNLANAYRLNGKTTQAEKHFSEAVKYSENQMSKLHYAQMLMTNGKSKEAIEWFTAYKPFTAGKESKRIDDFIELCGAMEKAQANQSNVDLKLAPFNSDFLDFSPAYFGDKIIFVSNRVSSKGVDKDKWTAQDFTDLFEVDTENLSKVRNASKRINSTLHEGPASYYKSGDKVIFTRSNMIKAKINDDKSKDVRLQLMESHIEKGKWSKPSALSLNSDFSSYCHPALSADESYMIFASDQPGGYGGMDLYKVTRDGDDWSNPVNLGSNINTSGNEVFPFVDSLNQLYFSSNLHAGFGGLDIFKANMVTGGSKSLYTDPKNVGLPINSIKDDFGVLSKDGFNSGYISSNRSGNDEIYSFSRNGNFMKGRVIDCFTKEPIPDAVVEVKEDGRAFLTTTSDMNGNFEFEVDDSDLSLFAKATKEGYISPEGCENSGDISVNSILELGMTSPESTESLRLCGRVINEECNYLLEDAKIKIVNLCSGEVTDLVSGKNGVFNYPLSENCQYKVIVTKDYFETKTHSFTTTKDQKDCLDLNVNMTSKFDLRDPSIGYEGGDRILLQEGTSIDLYNVYFDLNKYSIRQDATEELAWVLEILNQFPDMTVEIAAHTDSRASDAYNDDLSLNRAKAVRQYLLSKGIPAKRITAEGYGETLLKNNCSDNVNCSELEHQRNRRVEFKVTKFDGNAIISKEWSKYKK